MTVCAPNTNLGHFLTLFAQCGGSKVHQSLSSYIMTFQAIGHHVFYPIHFHHLFGLVNVQMQPNCGCTPFLRRTLCSEIETFERNTVRLAILCEKTG